MDSILIIDLQFTFMNDDDQQMFKIVVIGSSGTGKTNISTRYIRNQFLQGQKATVGVEFLAKIIKVQGKSVKITLWDTAGQQKYKSLSKVYYKGASGVLIVYDVTDPQSYLDVQSWMRLANENLNLNEVVLMVVGNKIDLEEERKVPTQRPIRQYKEKFDIDCWEVSAKTGYNVKQVFNELAEKIYMMNVGGSVLYPQSIVGGTFIDEPESIIAQPAPKQQIPSRVSKQIPEVIIEEEEPAVDLMKKPKPTSKKEEVSKKISHNPKKKGQSLSKSKVSKEKKKKSGCC